jgi:hypothetical protein
MTALSANKERRKRNTEGMKRGFISPAVSTQFYEGGLLCANASGLGAKAADTVNFRCLGVAIAQYLSPASAALIIEYEYGHEEWFPIDGPLNTAIATSTEKNATILDDSTLSNAATTTNDIPAGTIKGYEVYKGTNGVWLAVAVFASLNA